MKKWQSKVTKLFGNDPKIQFGDPREQGSNDSYDTIIGSGMDFLAINFWPKMAKDELLKIMGVCKYGENALSKKYFLPELTLKYHKSIICEDSLDVFSRVIQQGGKQES